MGGVVGGVSQEGVMEALPIVAGAAEERAAKVAVHVGEDKRVEVGMGGMDLG